ncbi:hypothetical protein CRENBAI_016495 [Crenichthys baileyi]|uniref:Uncharacterized protein n=1 Tax=Crenichthys baileyi TaxID=28760 RepID=A0AAV9S6V4_9TELE
MLEDPATTHLQCSYCGKDVPQNLVIHGPIHPLNTVQSSCPLCRKASPKPDVFTPMVHSWDTVHEIVLILFPPDMEVGDQILISCYQMKIKTTFNLVSFF